MTEKFRAFVQNYWEYYRELEDELLATKRYVDFNVKNYKTFSVEYLKLFQAVCSEIDVLGKIIASSLRETFNVDDRNNNINKWWYVIQNCKVRTGEAETNEVGLNQFECVFLDRKRIIPWDKFAVRYAPDTAGRMRYNPVNSTIPKWWSSYNKVKHNRMCIQNEVDNNYALANLGNLIEAIAGLYVLELYYMQQSGSKSDLEAFANRSVLFEKQEFVTSEDIDLMFKESD